MLKLDMFLSELHVKPIKEMPGWWEVQEPLRFQYQGATITVPKGFKTDFASVPRILWSVLPPIGTYTESAVLHDFLYYKGKYATVQHEQLTREKADKIFLAAMLSQDVNKFTAYFMYGGVRIFGGLRAELLNNSHF